MVNDAINATVETLKYVEKKCSDDFVIHVEHKIVGSELEIKHFVFGCVDWSLFDYTRWHVQNKFFPRASIADAESVILKSNVHDSTNIVLLSNDIIYVFSFVMKNDWAQVTIDLSSAIFGKGSYYDYVTISCRGKMWQMYSQFPRGSAYNRKKGTLYECLDLFLITEKEMEHPYQEHIDKHLRLYTDTIKHKRKFI
jgi:hypothetical protein